MRRTLLNDSKILDVGERCYTGMVVGVVRPEKVPATSVKLQHARLHFDGSKVGEEEQER